MTKILSSKLFWFVVTAVTVIVFFLLIHTERLIKAEIQVLIIPKSELASQNFESIMSNALNLPKTLTFYELILENNQKISSDVKYFSRKDKKDFWNSKIKTERVGNSGIVKITALDVDSNQAKIIAEQSAIDLATVLSRYYNVKADLDVRILEEPIVTNVTLGNFLTIFLKSLLAGILAGFLDYFIISLFPKKSPEEKIEFKSSNLDFSRRESIAKDFTINFNNTPKTSGAKPAFSNIIEKQKEFISKMKSETKEDKEDKQPKGESSSSLPSYSPATKKAPAPSNLPVAGDTQPIAEKKMEGNNTKTGHPSEEDIKERLNKLLSGQL